MLAVLKTISAPKNRQYVIGGLVGLVALVMLVWLYQKGKQILSDSAANQVDVNPANLTYQISDYSISADSINTAMQGAFPDIEATLEVLDQMQTPDDLRQLIRSYGERPRYWFSVPIFEGSLTQIMQHAFSGSDLTEIKERFNHFNIPF